jgi:16S rRNA (guanine527-N7)-methyltransferase
MTFDWQSVPRGTIEKLELYEALLKKWTKSINLIGASTIDKIWERHFEDAMRLLPYVDEGNIIDIGSGCGIPGLVLAMAGHSHVHLVEKDKRKSIFLKEVARQTETHVQIHTCLMEEYAGPKGDIITCRAFASLNHILSVAEKYRQKGGKYLCLKGKDYKKEVEDIQKNFECTAFPTPLGVIIEIKDK